MQPARFASYDEAMNYLYALTNYERGFTYKPRTTPKLGLERISKLLEFARNPERRLRAVHIAGTKGKGSTATMVAAVLSHAGNKTGLFVSPHVEDVRERIQIDGRWVPEESVVAQMNRLHSYLQRCEAKEDGIYKPTFFEVFTAIAFMEFESEGVDFAVAEVGMGGRLDTTNVLDPLVCAITPVSMDHMERLGNTLAAIAGEKAGIIKRGVPVVCGPQEPEALGVIREKCTEMDAPLYVCGADFAARRDADGTFSVGTWNGSVDRLRLAMPGEHQLANAAVAVGILTLLRERGHASLADEQIRGGLAAAFCPARVELVRRRPLTVIDSAHNPASFRALLSALRSTFRFNRLVCVFAVAQDKDVDAILRLLAADASHIVFTQMNNPRACSLDTLAAKAERLGYTDYTAEGDLATALRRAEQLAGAHDLICICGSFYLAGDARKLLKDAAARTDEQRT